MRPFLLTSLSIFLLACNSSDNNSNPASKNALATPQSLEVFADSLVRLNKYTTESIETAAGFYQRLVPSDSAMADSAAVMFLRHVRSVVDSTNEKLFRDTTDYFDLVYNDSSNAPEKQKAFRQQLKQHHLLMQGDGEGGVYISPDYDWVNSVLQPRTSAPVDRYLTLLGRDEKDPALLDAGLAIDIKELVDRLITSEQFQAGKLPVSFADHVNSLNRFYLAVLLFGSDNSPALEYEELQVTEQYQSGYNYLLATYPNSVAAKIVAEWQAVVKSGNHKKVEDWKKQYALY